MYWIILAGLVICMLPVMALSAYSAKRDNQIHHQIQKRLAAGEKANPLIKEQSPYLLQHAFNPVDWYPWGDEALQKAKDEDKPIFLSIGYSTCHWCHVMAHESFENQAIADILNKWFISIKVDREERPDIDQMYMAATQKMTGSGGWPMSVFLLPDTSPFYAGTYFPPASVANRPGFKDLLTAIHKAWLENRSDLQESASRLISALEETNSPSGAAIKGNVLDSAFHQIEGNYDPHEGGFGQAPKFPQPAILSFLLSHYLATGREMAREMVLFTLKKMAAGGIYDQLGGGFHRYSVDDKWFVPHFEKMLYDQAQLVGSYLDGFQITQEKEYGLIAREIFAYTLRDMYDPGSGFYSAEDADSENPYDPGKHSEGAFYLWTKEDIVKRLGAEDADFFNYLYGVKGEGNVRQDPMAEFLGRNILHRSHDLEQAAGKFNASSDRIEGSLKESKRHLFSIREQRRRPHLDDKVITGWNGMMIGALARGSRILQDPQLLDTAIKTATFVKTHLYSDSNRTLQRRYRRNSAGLAGQLDDYTYLVDGLLTLYQASHNPQWLSWAVNLTGRQIELFWNNKGNFFYDSVADPTVKIRMRDRHDGAEPAANSVAARNLLRLGQLENKPEWQQMARQLMESFSEAINRYPPALPLMLTAWQQIDTKPVQVVIAGKRGNEDTESLLEVVDKDFFPSRLLLLADGDANQSYLAKRLPFMQTVAPLNGKATAYVCFDFTCKMPVTDPVVLKGQLEALKIEQRSGFSSGPP